MLPAKMAGIPGFGIPGLQTLILHNFIVLAIFVQKNQSYQSWWKFDKVITKLTGFLRHSVYSALVLLTKAGLTRSALESRKRQQIGTS